MVAVRSTYRPLERMRPLNVRTTVLFLLLMLPAATQAQERLAPEEGRRDAIRLRQIEAFLNVHHEALFEAHDVDARATLEGMLWRFIEQEPPPTPQDVAAAYRHLFSLARSDSAFASAQLEAVIRGLANHTSDAPATTYAEASVLLAERSGAYGEALELVDRGIDSLHVQMERDRAWFEDDSLFQAMFDEQRSLLVDARGWIYYLAGDTVRAEQTLLEAHALWPANRTNLFRLGQLSEARSDVEQAEQYYRTGALTAAPGDNPNRAALRRLYERRHGSPDGWEEYAAAFEVADRALRRDRVLAQGATPPTQLPRFELNRLGGGTLSSDALKGRVTVINFWGIWCVWCVREMPDLQQLHARYRESDEVRILTINNDESREEVVHWMQEHGYDFPVLWDGGFAAGAGVTGYPTTWFVDRNGTIAYQKRGWTEQLLEEFTWRIDSLLEQAAEQTQ